MSRLRLALVCVLPLASACPDSQDALPAELRVDARRLAVTSATPTSSIASGIRTVRVALPVDSDPATPGDESLWTVEFALADSVFRDAPIGTEVFAHGTATFAVDAPGYTYAPTPAGNPEASAFVLYETDPATSARPTSGTQGLDGSVFLSARSKEVVRVYVDSSASGVMGADGSSHEASVRMTVDVPINP